DVLNVARKGRDGSTESARAEVLAGVTARGGAGDAAGRLEAQRQTAAGGGESSIRGREPAGDGLAGAAGDGRAGQARNKLTQFLPKPKTAQEIAQEAKRNRLGGVLGIEPENMSASSVTGRIHELVNSGKARDVETLLKA